MQREILINTFEYFPRIPDCPGCRCARFWAFSSVPTTYREIFDRLKLSLSVSQQCYHLPRVLQGDSVLKWFARCAKMNDTILKTVDNKSSRNEFRISDEKDPSPIFWNLNDETETERILIWRGRGWGCKLNANNIERILIWRGMGWGRKLNANNIWPSSSRNSYKLLLKKL